MKTIMARHNLPTGLRRIMNCCCKNVVRLPPCLPRLMKNFARSPIQVLTGPNIA